MDVMRVAEQELPVWPPRQPVDRWIEPTVFIAKFADAPAFHGALRRTILRLTENPALNNAVAGGEIGSSKIYGVDKWGCPAATLVHRRALQLFRIVTRQREAVVDLSWASVYRSGDSCIPHSHPRTMAAIVYAVDLGDEGAEGNGRFCFADPRLAACCREEPGYMSTPCAPELTPGTMIIFPGQVVHFVNVYRGERPRITMSWNLNRAAVAGDAVPYEINRPQ